MRANLAEIQAEPAAPDDPPIEPTAIEVYEMIREAAYYRAEKRGFVPGLEAEDWRVAEAEVLARLSRPCS